MPCVGFDILIAFINKSDELHPYAKEIFYQILSGEIKEVYIPISILLEYEVKLRYNGISDEEIKEDIKNFLELFNSKTLPLTPEILSRASEIRKIYNLPYFDSLHIAFTMFKDRIIISSNIVYDRIGNIKRLDPLQMVKVKGINAIK